MTIPEATFADLLHWAEVEAPEDLTVEGSHRCHCLLSKYFTAKTKGQGLTFYTSTHMVFGQPNSDDELIVRRELVSTEQDILLAFDEFAFSYVDPINIRFVAQWLRDNRTTLEKDKHDA